MRGKYFVDELKSFSFGSPDVTEAWKHLIFEQENNGFDLVAFRLPRQRSMELVEVIEKFLKDKLQ